MTQDIRWKQRFSNFNQVYDRLNEVINVNDKQPADMITQIAMIKLFELVFELSWKTMKDYLEYHDLQVKFPRDVIKQAFASEILEDGQLWIDMLDERNLLAHVYDQKRAEYAAERISKKYFSGLTQLQNFFQKKLKSEIS